MSESPFHILFSFTCHEKNDTISYPILSYLLNLIYLNFNPNLITIHLNVFSDFISIITDSIFLS